MQYLASPMEILLQRQVVGYHRLKPSNVYIVSQMVSNFEKRNGYVQQKKQLCSCCKIFQYD